MKTDPEELAQRLDVVPHGELNRALAKFSAETQAFLKPANS